MKVLSFYTPQKCCPAAAFCENLSGKENCASRDRDVWVAQKSASYLVFFNFFY